MATKALSSQAAPSPSAAPLGRRGWLFGAVPSSGGSVLPGTALGPSAVMESRC